MADAVELFQLNRSGLWFKDTKILVKLIWHFGAWLVAELNRTKRLVQRLDHDKRLWVAPTFLNKKGSFVGLCQVLEPPQISNGR
jgi:hypothetical protein